MATIQSEFGKIRIFEDFIGPEWLIGETGASGVVGQFRLIGNGHVDGADSGATSQESDPCLNGVIRLLATDEDLHSCGITTSLMFNPGLMGTMVLEARVQMSDLDTKQVFIGFSDINADAQILEDTLVNIDTGAATTITNTASDFCGFLLSSEATDDEDWHAVYNGGTATAITLSTSADLDSDAVAAEWQIMRVEIDNDGTARWYIDGEIKQTTEGAVSTASTDFFAGQIIIENLANTSTTESIDIDYILITANRDWTV